MTIMGSLGGIEAGLRQMRRTRPLETIRVDLGDDGTVTAPTLAEALRVKAYLVVQRNVVRDFLDVVAADRLGEDAAVEVLLHIDDYYGDRSGSRPRCSRRSSLPWRTRSPATPTSSTNFRGTRDSILVGTIGTTWSVPVALWRSGGRDGGQLPQRRRVPPTTPRRGRTKRWSRLSTAAGSRLAADLRRDPPTAVGPGGATARALPLLP